jgi:hypothetical protein
VSNQVLRIRRIRKFLGLPEPDLDPFMRGTDPVPYPDPYHQAKIVRKTLIPTVVTSL